MPIPMVRNDILRNRYAKRRIDGIIHDNLASSSKNLGPQHALERLLVYVHHFMNSPVMQSPGDIDLVAASAEPRGQPTYPLEPSLFAAGFQFDGRNKPSIPIYVYLDYSRPGEHLRLARDRRDSNRFIGLTAELLGPAESVTTIAATSLSGIAKLPKCQVTAEVQMRLDTFVENVNAFLITLASSEAP